MTLLEMAEKLIEVHNKNSLVKVNDFYVEREYHDYEIEDTFKSVSIDILDNAIGYAIFPEYEHAIRIKFNAGECSPHIDLLSSDDTIAYRGLMLSNNLRDEIFEIFLVNEYNKRSFRYLYDTTLKSKTFTIYGKSHVNTLISTEFPTMIMDMVARNKPEQLAVLVNTNWHEYYDEFIKFNNLNTSPSDQLPVKKEELDFNAVLHNTDDLTRIKSSLFLSTVYQHAECTAILLRWLKKYGIVVEDKNENMEL
jgi:hypothetical protein